MNSCLAKYDDVHLFLTSIYNYKNIMNKMIVRCYGRLSVILKTYITFLLKQIFYKRFFTNVVRDNACTLLSAFLFIHRAARGIADWLMRLLCN